MKKIFIILVLFAAMPFIVAAQPGRMTIVAYGDSNGENECGWVNALQEVLPETRVVNKSRSGRTLSFTNMSENRNGLLYIDTVLQDLQASSYSKSIKYFIINLGTNDALVKYKDETDVYKPNLSQLIGKIKKSRLYKKNHMKIVLLEPFPVNEKAPKFKVEKYGGASGRVESFASQMKEVAVKQKVIFVPVRDLISEEMNAKNCRDGIHLNAELSRIVAQELAKVIK